MEKISKHLRLADTLKITVLSGQADLDVVLDYTDGFGETLGRSPLHINSGDTLTVNFEYKKQQAMLEEIFDEVETKFRVIRIQEE